MIDDELRGVVNEALTRIGPSLTSDPDLALLLFKVMVGKCRLHFYVAYNVLYMTNKLHCNYY